jgi:hypothetical protein
MNDSSNERGEVGEKGSIKCSTSESCFYYGMGGRKVLINTVVGHLRISPFPFCSNFSFFLPALRSPLLGVKC